MDWRRASLLLLIAALLSILAGPKTFSAPLDGAVDIFYSPGCSSCYSYVQNQLGPALQAGGFNVYLREIFIDCEDRRELGKRWDKKNLPDTMRNPILTVFADDQWIIGGKLAVSEVFELLETPRDQLGVINVPEVHDPHMYYTWEPAREVESFSMNIPVSEAFGQEVSGNSQAEQIDDQSMISLLIITGLIDGINPCAFSVMLILVVFGVTMMGLGRFDLLKFGLFYIVGMFITYLAIGMGLLTALQRFLINDNILTVIRIIGGGLAFGIGMMMILNTVLSRPLLRLTISRQRRMKLVPWIQKGTGLSLLAAGSLMALYSIPCSGAIYFAAMTAVAGGTATTIAGQLMYLGVYNLSFIMPITAGFFICQSALRADNVLSFIELHSTSLRILYGVMITIIGTVIVLRVTF